MRATARTSGFTMAEMMIAMAGSAIIIGALMFSSLGLQRAFRASELYAAAQADQRRLLDYLTRDLRRSVGIATSNSVSGVDAAKVEEKPVSVENGMGLLLTLPG